MNEFYYEFINILVYCQHHVSCAFVGGFSWMSASRLVHNTSSLFEFVNKSGNSVVCDVLSC